MAGDGNDNLNSWFFCGFWSEMDRTTECLTNCLKKILLDKTITMILLRANVWIFCVFDTTFSTKFAPKKKKQIHAGTRVLENGQQPPHMMPLLPAAMVGLWKSQTNFFNFFSYISFLSNLVNSVFHQDSKNDHIFFIRALVSRVLKTKSCEPSNATLKPKVCFQLQWKFVWFLWSNQFWGFIKTCPRQCWSLACNHQRCLQPRLSKNSSVGVTAVFGAFSHKEEPNNRTQRWDQQKNWSSSLPHHGIGISERCWIQLVVQQGLTLWGLTWSVASFLSMWKTAPQARRDNAGSSMCVAALTNSDIFWGCHFCLFGHLTRQKSEATSCSLNALFPKWLFTWGKKLLGKMIPWVIAVFPWVNFWIGSKIDRSFHLMCHVDLGIHFMGSLIFEQVFSLHDPSTTSIKTTKDSVTKKPMKVPEDYKWSPKSGAKEF